MTTAQKLSSGGKPIPSHFCDGVVLTNFISCHFQIICFKFSERLKETFQTSEVQMEADRLSWVNMSSGVRHWTSDATFIFSFFECSAAGSKSLSSYHHQFKSLSLRSPSQQTLKATGNYAKIHQVVHRKMSKLMNVKIPSVCLKDHNNQWEDAVNVAWHLKTNSTYTSH